MSEKRKRNRENKTDIGRPKEILERFYVHQIGEISSKQELEKAIEEGELDLELNASNHVSPQKQAEISEKSPDEIELAGHKYEIDYQCEEEDDGLEFKGVLTVESNRLVDIKNEPQIPSEIPLFFKLDTDPGYAEETTFDEAKERARQHLIHYQWKEWQNSDDYPGRSVPEDFFAHEVMPEPPEPIPYGLDPVTNETLYAHPAYSIRTYSTYSGQEIETAASYYQNEQRAEEINKKSQNLYQDLAEEEKAKAFKEQADDLYSRLRRDTLETDIIHYSEFEINGEKFNFNEELRKANDLLTDNRPKEALDLLDKLEEILEKAQEREKRAQQLVEDNLNLCPICQEELTDSGCLTTHSTKNVDFSQESRNPLLGTRVVLKQIETNSGLVLAQLTCSAAGKIEILKEALIRPRQDDENPPQAWEGQEIDKAEVVDFDRILTDEEAEELIRQKEADEYWRHFDEQMDRVRDKHDDLRRGKFRKFINQETGEVQWRAEYKSGKTTYRFIVQDRANNPTSTGLSYFFYPSGPPIIDQPTFKSFHVLIEEPLPENEPEQTKKGSEKNQSEEEIEEVNEDSLKALEDRFNKH